MVILQLTSERTLTVIDKGSMFLLRVYDKKRTERSEIEVFHFERHSGSVRLRLSSHHQGVCNEFVAELSPFDSHNIHQNMHVNVTYDYRLRKIGLSLISRDTSASDRLRNNYFLPENRIMRLDLLNSH